MSLVRAALVVLAALLAAAGAHAQIAFRGAASASIASVSASGITHVGTGAAATDDTTGCNNTVSPAMPNGLAGDVLVALVNSREDNAVVNITAGTGWTLAYSAIYGGGQELQAYIYYKVATGTNTAADPLTLTQSVSCNSITARVSRFRGVDTAQPLETSPIPSGNVVQQNSNNLDTGTQTTTLNGSMLLVAGFINNNRTVTEGGGWSQSFDSSINLNRDLGLSLHYMAQASAGAASISNWGFSGGGAENFGVIFALRPQSGATGGLTINVPAGTVANDVMLASIAARPCSGTSGNPCTTTITPPAGWTLVNSFDQTTGGGTGGFGNVLYVYRRVATGAEPASYTWQFGGAPVNNGAVGGIVSFSGVDTTSPIVAEAGQLTANATSHTAPSINTGIETNTMLVASHAANSSTDWTSVEGMTEAVDGASLAVPNGLGIAMSMYYQIQAAAGATGTRTAQYSSGAASDTGAAHLLSLRPGAPPQTVQVVMAGGVDNINAGSIFLSGTRSGAPEAVNTNSNTGTATITTAITTLTNNAWLIDAVGSGNAGGFTSPGAQAERWDTSAASSTGAASTKPVPAAGASSMQQTHSTTSNRTAHAVIAVPPAGASTIAFVSQNSANVNNSATLSWAHTVPGGAAGKLIVGIAIEAPGNPCPAASAVSAVTHAGVPLTRVATVDANSGAFCQRVEIWYLDFGAVVDHFSFSHAGSGVACLDQAITITAHDASHAAVDAGAMLVNLSTTNAKGSWTAILAGGGTLTDVTPGDGAATYQFAAGSNSVQLSFRYANLAATSETFGFNVSGAGISETTGTASGSDDPSFTMSQAGFRFRNVTDGNTTIPTQISGKPSNTGFNSKTLRVQAIRTDTVTGSCTGLFASQTRTVDLGAECNSPGTCAARQVSVNAANIATSNDNGGAGAAAYTGVSLAFNASSEADTVIAYPDAGQVSLHARYDLDPLLAGFEMIGSSNNFIVRPFGLAFPGVNHSSTAAGTLIGAAGDNFAMTVQGYQWAAGEDANNDGVPDAGVNITDDGTVPNFAATATVSVSTNLPGVAPGAVSRGAGCANPASIALAGGTGAAADWCYSEVGNVILNADVANYISAGENITGNSGLDGDAASGYVGRFKPKHFMVSGVPTLANRSSLACAPVSAFTYMNEALSLGFTLEARNTQNVLTQNYTGAYAKLNLATAADLGIGALNGATNLTPRVDLGLAPTGSFTNGSAALVAATGITRATPDAPDGPYTATQFGIAPNDNDPNPAGGVQMDSFDLDVDGVGGNDHFAIAPTTELRFGRLRLQNGNGPDSVALQIPLDLQYWNGSGFALNALDSCTTLARSNIALSFTGVIAACDTAVQEASIVFASGQSVLTLSAPGAGKTGSVVLTPNLGTAAGTYCPAAPATASPAIYLLGRWDDAADPDANANTAYDDKPTGRGTFGLYGSQPRNFIFFRENY